MPAMLPCRKWISILSADVFNLTFHAGTKTVITAAAKAGVQRVVLTSSIVALFGETPNPSKGKVLGPSDFNEVASMELGDHYEPYAYSKVDFERIKQHKRAVCM